MDFRYENKKMKQGHSFIVGCDEVGRGCLAGPVVAAAVILDSRLRVKDLSGVRDSKLLSARAREKLDGIIKQYALGWGIGEVDEKIIDEINIHQASLLAMKKAVEKLLQSVPSETFSGVILNPNASDLSAEAFLSNEVLTKLEAKVEGEESLDPGIIRSDALPQDDAKRVLVSIDGKFKIPNLKLEQEAVVDGDAKILSIAAASIIAKVYRDNLMSELHVKFPDYGLKDHKGYATFHHRQALKKYGLTPLHRVSFCEKYM